MTTTARDAALKYLLRTLWFGYGRSQNVRRFGVVMILTRRKKAARLHLLGSSGKASIKAHMQGAGYDPRPRDAGRESHAVMREGVRR